jgi:uncharacterized protein (DUF1800 family)
MRMVSEAAKAALVSTLCFLMVAPPSLMAEEPAVKVPVGSHVKPLTSQEKALHALNRLTFGPRPGDEAAVEKMGLEAWFQQQLNPEKIDDSALEARLDAFPAMRLSQTDLLRRFPSPQVIRQMAQRGASLPSDPVLHAVYADSLATYELGKKRQELAGAPAAATGDMAMGGDAAMKPVASASTDMAGGDMMGGDAAMTTTATPVAAAKGAKGSGRLASTKVPMLSAAEVNAVLALPADARMERLIAMSPDQMIAFREGLKPYQRPMLMQGLTPAQMEIVAAMQGGTRVVGAEAMEVRLVRDVYSERQLQAVMTDFWLNHFSVYARKNQNEPYYLPAYERETILPHALGKFENLLDATAQSPAMLMYLDNWQSVGPDSPFVEKSTAAVQRFNLNGPVAKNLPKGVNENYARELMELHTLGVNGGYTQKDVQEVAKVFTGWTIEKPYQADGGGAIFDASRHEGGDKLVLGHVIKSGGQEEGREVLHILATSPATAHFISTKLAVRFVSDNPSPALVDRMAATFLKSDGDIKAVLTTMFHSPEFWAPENYRAKVKTPIEFMASALRASNADVKNPLALVQAMDKLGMPIYGMQTPNGYSWTKTDWVSSNALISRMNFALVLSGDRVPGTKTNWPSLLGNGAGVATDGVPSAATEQELEALLLGEPAAEHTRATVMEQAKNPTAQKAAEESFAKQPVKEDGADMAAGQEMTAGLLGRRGGRGGGAGFQADTPETPLDTMAGLLLGSPDFQRR